MAYKRIEIKSNEYLVVDLQDDLILYTTKLDQEIAYSIFSSKLKKVALGRNLDSKQLTKLFAEFNPDNLKDIGLITINIIGGDESEDSTAALKTLLPELMNIDNESDVIDIRSCDAGTKVHPNSFGVDCYHGGIHALAAL